MKPTKLRSIFRMACGQIRAAAAAVMDHHCPVCGAGPGVDCRRSGYQPLIPQLHAGRLMLVPEATRISFSLRVLDRTETELLDGLAFPARRFGGDLNAALAQIRRDREWLLGKLPMQALREIPSP
jgi:hypothetical protein